MSKIVRGLASRAFVTMLIALGLDAVSLLVILNFVATTEISVEAGLMLFVLSTILLLLGYMVGIVVIGFLAISVLSRFWNRARKTGTST